MKIIKPHQIFIIVNILVLAGLIIVVFFQESTFSKKRQLNYDIKEKFFEGEVIRKVAFGQKDAYLVKVYKKGVSLSSLRKDKDYLLFINNGEIKTIIGRRIMIKGNADLLKKTRNSGFYKYLRKYKIESIVYGEYQIISAKGENFYHSFKFLVNEKRQVLSNYIVDIWGRDKGGIVKALLIADKSLMDKEEKKELSIIGITHIFAISGMHIGIIIELLSFFLLKFRLNRRKIFIYISLIILFYLFFIDFPSSALRAYFMFLFNALGLLAGRKAYKNLNLLISLNLIIIFNPFLILYDVGLKLSFLASFSLINIYPLLRQLFDRLVVLKEIKIEFLEKIREYTISSILASFSVMIGTFPVLISEFEYFSLISVISNLLFLWIVPFLLIFSILILIFKLLEIFISDVLLLFHELLFDYFDFCKKLVLNLEQYNLENLNINSNIYWIWLLMLIFLVWIKKDYEKEFNLIKNY